MADISITIKTVIDKAVADLKKVGQGITDIGKSAPAVKKSSINFTELNSAVSLARQALQTLNAVYQDTVGETLRYADTIRQMSAISGAGAEDTSRLIQMIDDLGIETSTLETAMRGAAQKGIVLTTENLAKMSDEYLKLAPGVERNTYLLDNFGRSGLEMAQVLNKGGDALRNMSANVEKNLILTDRQVKEARRLEIANDNLKDSWQGIVTELSMAVIPVLADATEGLNNQIQAQQELIATQDVSKMSHQEQIKWVQEHTAMAKALATAVGVEETGALRNAIPALNDANKATEDLADSTGDAAQKSFDLSAAFGELNKQLFFTQASAGLDAESSLALARSLGLVNEKTYVTLSQLDTLKKKYDTNGDGAIDATEATNGYLEAVQNLGAAINDLQDKTVTVTTVHETVYNKATTNHKGVDEEFEPYAEGGPVSGNNPIVVGEQGPEVFVPNQAGNIVPNDQLGGVNIYGDITVVANNPTDFINQLRNARKSGAAYIHR